MNCCHSPSEPLSIVSFGFWVLDIERKSDIHTSKENESVDTDLFVSRDADIVYQVLLVSHGAQGCHDPAIAVAALAYI